MRLTSQNEKIIVSLAGVRLINKKMRVACDTLGCKLNQAETELLARQLTAAGCQLVPPSDECDIYILNTCTVTHIADRKSRHWLRLARRRHPHALLVATGCYAERAPQELAQIAGVDLVVGNDQKLQLLNRLEKLGYSPSRSGDAASSHYNGSRTRSFIKVQDGCNSSCAYCVVPVVRSHEESLPVTQVIDEIKRRLANGYKEIVLTGVKIGSYRRDGLNLKGLLELILAETGVVRLRLSSLQPHEISPELIRLWRDSRLCRHFHLSLQNGSDGVLRRMKRRYSVSDYSNAVSSIRSLVPEAAITTDVMVGFPGGTDAEFAESYAFCRRLGFARIHVFPYSPRPGTQAAEMLPTVSAEIKKQRTLRMLALARKSMADFNQQFVGQAMPVLWERQDNGIWAGLTDNYIKVYTRSSEDLTNKLLPAKLVAVRDDGVWGETSGIMR